MFKRTLRSLEEKITMKLMFINGKIYLFNKNIKLFNLHQNFVLIDYYAARKMYKTFLKLLATTFFLKNFLKKKKN